MTGIADIAISARVVTVTVPVAVYFLVLGLLHTRHRPQMLTGRADFALLMGALGPLVFLPVVAYLGGAPAVAVLALAALAAAAMLLAPGGRSWVVYNVTPRRAHDAIAAALRTVGATFQTSPDGFTIDGGRIRVDIEGFWLLRNATVRLRGGDGRFARAFQAALARRLAQMECEPSAMAVSMLLVAVMMLAAPLAMVAQDVPQIVRMLTDLLP